MLVVCGSAWGVSTRNSRQLSVVNLTTSHKQYQFNTYFNLLIYSECSTQCKPLRDTTINFKDLKLTFRPLIATYEPKTYLSKEDIDMATHSTFPVIVHPYRSAVRGSCAYEIGTAGAQNAIVFIGGLKDGPHTSPFIWTVADCIKKEGKVDYSVFEFRMRSSYNGYGTSSLSDDVDDTSSLVKYLRSIGKQKIVLFGHSTGCQVVFAVLRSIASHRW